MKKSIPYIVGGVVGMGLAFAMFLIWQNYKKAKDNKSANDKGDESTTEAPAESSSSQTATTEG